MRIRSFATLALATLVLAAPALAQGRGPGGGSPQVDPSQKSVVTGAVVSFTAGAGAGTPTLLVRKDDGAQAAYVLGPYRYVSAQGFVAQAGDRVELTLLACSACDQGFAVAEVKNLTRGVTLALRAADGTPLFSGNRGPHGGQGPGHGQGRGNGDGLCDGTGPDLSRTASLEGVVASFDGGPGSGQPTVVLTTADGAKSFLVSPYRSLAAAGFTFAAGMKLGAVVAPVTRDGQEEWVALSVTDRATGLTVQLRDASTGRPTGGRRS